MTRVLAVVVCASRIGSVQDPDWHDGGVLVCCFVLFFCQLACAEFGI